MEDGDYTVVSEVILIRLDCARGLPSLILSNVYLAQNKMIPSSCWKACASLGQELSLHEV